MRVKNDGGRAELVLGETSYLVSSPVVVEHWDGEASRSCSAGYDTFDGSSGTARVALSQDCALSVTDTWRLIQDTLIVERHVIVDGSSDGGFLTEFGLLLPGTSLADTSVFLPGMLYGDPERVNPFAIGGAEALREPGEEIRVREDRLPAPMVGVRLAFGATITLLHADPDGTTSLADAENTDPEQALVDPAVQVGGLRLSQPADGLRLGFTLPGTEGEVTYRGNTFPDGQLRRWRRLYHPLAPGHLQRYSLAIRLGQHESFPELVRRSWRWAWQLLAPVVHDQDIPAARAALVDQLASSVVETESRAGIPLFLSAVTGQPDARHLSRADDALMGFTGRNTDAAFYLVREAAHTHPERGRELRRLGGKILDSFTALPTSPPAGEGFDLRTGAPVAASPHQQRRDTMHLRGLAEGVRTTVRAWRAERLRGVEQPEWLRWSRQLGEWLLSQQRPDGSLPRSWLVGTDTVVSVSGHATYVVIAPFVELARVTGIRSFFTAAEAAASYCLEHGHRDGSYVGGTLDNPDVVDKEAGTLALEGYLLLYEDSSDPSWLTAAQDAADYAETWIYLWDVPMPPGPDTDRGWKNAVPTTGVQLIATGHSLVDQYMTADVASYAKLGHFLGDEHYRQVARLLLHNTKSMVALPDRRYDLAGPGWQQEHWSLAPPRGNGLHRGWLPWITCNHLEGLTTLEDFSPELYAELTRRTGRK